MAGCGFWQRELSWPGTHLFPVVFCLIDLVEDLPAQFIVDAVLECGASRWCDLGPEIYSRNSSRIEELTADKPTPTDKLRAIIKERKLSVGLKCVAEDIVKACREIPNPIYHDVIADARRRQRLVQCSEETSTLPAPTDSGQDQRFMSKMVRSQDKLCLQVLRTCTQLIEQRIFGFQVLVSCCWLFFVVGLFNGHKVLPLMIEVQSYELLYSLRLGALPICYRVYISC